MQSDILLVGVPRSGTTWISKILECSRMLDYIHEPDNERHTFSAYYYKRGLPRFPFFDANSNPKNYYKLFEHALFKPYISSGSYSNRILSIMSNISPEKIEKNLSQQGKNSNRILPANFIYPLLPKQIGQKSKPRLIKSVHSLLSLEFILTNFKVSPIIILRHPASIISSHLNLNNPDIDRGIYNYKELLNFLIGHDHINIGHINSVEARGGLQLALFYKYISKIAEGFPQILTIKYEDFLEDAVSKSRSLFSSFNLKWSNSVEEYIGASNKKGEGYETNRLLSQQKDVWKNRLSKYQINEIKKGYSLVRNPYYQSFTS